MRKFNVGDRTKYTGSPNTWTFEKDLFKNHTGKIYQVLKTPETINYMVEFENGLCVSIDPKNLKLLN
jgi:hypothetical protein